MNDILRDPATALWFLSLALFLFGLYVQYLIIYFAVKHAIRNAGGLTRPAVTYHQPQAAHQWPEIRE